MSCEQSITNKRPRVSTMDIAKQDATETPELKALETDTADLGRHLKPEAPSIEAFLLEPTKYRPKTEFLGGVASYVEDETVLTHAVKVQNSAAVAALLEAGADPNFANKKGVTPISAAAHKGNTEIMRSLIDAGSNVNACNSSGSTALIQASHFGHVAAVQLLVQSRASADFANHKGTTALMRASQEGHLDISDILLTSGADVNRKNHEGMNALMLASQRGHGTMVSLLIRSAAAMDEQTAQGSTALMLACKRGHAKCVEVLVAMGAEIFIRDIRSRTAWDTATKRGYMELLAILNTQLQVRRTQEYRHAQRTILLLDMRALHQKGRLRLSASERNVQRLKQAVMTTQRAKEEDLIKKVSGNDSNLSCCSVDINAMEISETVPTYVPTSTISCRSYSPCTDRILTLYEAQLMVARPENVAAVQVLSSLLAANTSATSTSTSASTFASTFTSALDRKCNTTDIANSSTLTENHSSMLIPIRPGFALWDWPVLLKRCMDLPPGVFELIADMLPMPRVWQWSILRLKRRCKLAPHQAVCDINIIMDEIITDACIFPGPQQSLLVRISQHPEIHAELQKSWGISPSLLDSMKQWSDVQSLLARVTESEVTFRHPLAKKMLAAALAMYKWHRMRHNGVKALGLDTATGSSSCQGCGDDAAERLEGEDGSDVEGLMDQDTETELPAEGDADDAQDDEDDSDA